MWLLMTALWGYAGSWSNEVSLFLAGPGISGYSHATEKAGPSLAQCLRQAEEVIPSQQHQETPVYLGATAGMRLLRYHRACHFPPQHCTGDHHRCLGWGPLGQSPWRCFQFTLWPSSATDLSPKTPWACPPACPAGPFSLTPTSHLLQPPTRSAKAPGA